MQLSRGLIAGVSGKLAGMILIAGLLMVPQASALSLQPVAAAPQTEPGVAASERPISIEDVYYEDGSLNVISKPDPVQVKRTFILKEPNRFIVDISPAVLGNSTITRVVPHQDPDVVTFKARQFDENTVRIVTQLTRKPLQPRLTHDPKNRLLQIRFF